MHRHSTPDIASGRLTQAGLLTLDLELGLEMEHAALRFWTSLADGKIDELRRERDHRDVR